MFGGDFARVLFTIVLRSMRAHPLATILTLSFFLVIGILTVIFGIAAKDALFVSRDGQIIALSEQLAILKEEKKVLRKDSGELETTLKSERRAREGEKNVRNGLERQVHALGNEKREAEVGFAKELSLAKETLAAKTLELREADQRLARVIVDRDRAREVLSVKESELNHVRAALTESQGEVKRQQDATGSAKRERMQLEIELRKRAEVREAELVDLREKVRKTESAAALKCAALVVSNAGTWGGSQGSGQTCVESLAKAHSECKARTTIGQCGNYAKAEDEPWVAGVHCTISDAQGTNANGFAGAGKSEDAAFARALSFAVRKGFTSGSCSRIVAVSADVGVREYAQSKPLPGQ